MNLEEMRKRLGEIQAKLAEFSALETFSDEDVTTIDELNNEFTTLKASIEAKEKVEAVLASANTSARKTEAQPVAKIEVKKSKADTTGGFTNFGEYLSSVRRAANGDMDKRFQNTMFEKTGEDGGFLVPEDFMSSIAKKVEGDDSLLTRTRRMTVSGNALSLPTDELQPWMGGIQAYWTDEGAAITESKHKLGKANWKLNKMAALIKMTDELLEDTTALESYVLSHAPVAMTHVLNSAIISGDGVGKPEGILNSSFAVTVTKENAQAADTIVAENIVKMFSRLLPQSRGRAAWYINPAVEAQLRLLKDGAGQFIYLAPGSQMNQSPYGQLMGLPVIPMLGSLPQLGDKGDIILADLDSYYTITKGGVKQDISSHLYFDRAIQTYRFIFRVDGKCPYKTPVVTEFGNYEMSSIVVLEDRA